MDDHHWASWAWKSGVKESVEALKASDCQEESD